MSQLVVIKAVSRSETGKGYARKLRKRGLIPGVILDGKGKPIELDPKLLGKAYSTGKVFSLALDENAEREVRIHEVHVSPTKRVALHVDLMYV